MVLGHSADDRDFGHPHIGRIRLDSYFDHRHNGRLGGSGFIISHLGIDCVLILAACFSGVSDSSAYSAAGPGASSPNTIGT